MSMNLNKTFIAVLIALILLCIISLQVSDVKNKVIKLDSNVETINDQISKINSGNGINVQNTNTSVNQNDPMNALIENDAILGNPNAKVTIVQWSDFECPYCQRFFSTTMPELKKNYIDTGKVKFVHRDFPLNFHANAKKAAESAECAGEQGKYYEMHDLLYGEGVEGGIATFKKYAQDIGLDMTKFNDCLDNGRMEAEVNQDLADGIKNGITGTPSFIVNGEFLEGAQSFSAFKEIIEKKLKE